MRQRGIKSVVFFPAGHAQQWINGHLQNGHARADGEIGNDGDTVSGKQRETQRPQRSGKKSQYHHGLFRKAFDQKAGGDGHHAVGDKKSKSQKTCSGQAHAKAADDVRDDGTENIGQQRDDKKSEEDQADRVAASRHEQPLS